MRPSLAMCAVFMATASAGAQGDEPVGADVRPPVARSFDIGSFAGLPLEMLEMPTVELKPDKVQAAPPAGKAPAPSRRSAKPSAPVCTMRIGDLGAGDDPSVRKVPAHADDRMARPSACVAENER